MVQPSSLANLAACCHCVPLAPVVASLHRGAWVVSHRIAEGVLVRRVIWAVAVPAASVLASPRLALATGTGQASPVTGIAWPVQARPGVAATAWLTKLSVYGRSRAGRRAGDLGAVAAAQVGRTIGGLRGVAATAVADAGRVE